MVTVLPAAAVPHSVGVASSVLSPRSGPVPGVATATPAMITGAAGGAVSIVSGNSAEARLVLPAASVAVAVKV